MATGSAMKRTATWLVACCMFSVTADATRAETIRDALAAAYDHNPVLNAQRAATRAADEGVAIAKSGLRPTVSASVTQQFSRTINSNPVGGGRVGQTAFPFGYGVQIDQALFSGFRTVNSINAQEAQVRSSRAQLSSTEQDVLFNAAAAYADIIFFDRLVDIRRRNLAFLREQVRSANARLEVGEGTRTDVAESQAQLVLARSGVTTAQASAAAARATFVQFVGRAPGTLATPTVPSRLIPPSVDAAVAIALRDSPAIRGSEHLVDAQAFAVKIEEGTLLPSLGAQFSANEQRDFGAADSRTTAVSGSLQLSVPIYQGGAASARVRQAKEQLGQQRIIVDQTRDQVRVTTVAAYTRYQAAVQNVSSNRQQVAAARLALEGVTEERNVGQRTQLDVLQAQATVLQAEEGLAQARRDRVVAAYQTVQAIGRLSARRLGLKVKYYDPREHYVEVVDRWFGLRTPDGR